MFRHDNPILPDDDPIGVGVDFDGTARGLGVERVFVGVEPHQACLRRRVEAVEPAAIRNELGAFFLERLPRRPLRAFGVRMRLGVSDAPVELVGFARRKCQGNIGLRRCRAALLAPVRAVPTNGVMASGIAKTAQFLEYPDQRQSLMRRLPLVLLKHRFKPVEPGPHFRQRLAPTLAMELRRIRPDDLPNHFARDVQIAADRLDRSLLFKIRAADLRNRLHDQHLKLGLPKRQETYVDPYLARPDWMPITPKQGPLFHADSHPA